MSTMAVSAVGEGQPQPGKPRLFVFGFGYVTLALTRALKSANWCVSQANGVSARLPLLTRPSACV
jgi:hypothetical protein